MGSADWDPAPPVSSGSPVAFQAGTLGTGIGIGCGVGIGIGSPLSLGSLPIFGQAVQGVSAGLGGLLPIIHGASTTVRTAIKGLGIPGLDAGFGCGVGVGYGFGVGLMIKPSVAEQLLRSGTQLAGQVTSTISSKLRSAGVHHVVVPQPQQLQQHNPSASVTPVTTGSSQTNSGLPAVGPYFSSSVGQAAPRQTAAGVTDQSHWGDISGMVGSPAAAGSSSSSSSGTASTSAPHIGNDVQQQDVLVLRTLLEQQQEIVQLKKQNKQLKHAVCRLDPRAPFCDSAAETGSTRSSRRLRNQPDSSDWPE